MYTVPEARRSGEGVYGLHDIRALDKGTAQEVATSIIGRVPKRYDPMSNIRISVP
jgi:hypothetical protein